MEAMKEEQPEEQAPAVAVGPPSMSGRECKVLHDIITAYWKSEDVPVGNERDAIRGDRMSLGQIGMQLWV